MMIYAVAPWINLKLFDQLPLGKVSASQYQGMLTLPVDIGPTSPIRLDHSIKARVPGARPGAGQPLVPLHHGQVEQESGRKAAAHRERQAAQ